jgi:transposase
MDVIFPRCAGIDVHQDNVVVCRIIRDEAGQRIAEVRKFPAMTCGLVELADWLNEGGVTHSAMEGTGVYWKPVWNILTAQGLNVWVVNAHHLKTVPGRKTDKKDARWIGKCLEHGLLEPSFVPDAGLDALRELTRCRANFVQERARVVNRIQKTLEPCNIKLASVASDVMGVSGRAMLKAIVEGEEDPSALAAMAKGRLRDKTELLEQALEGRVRPVHRLILSELLAQADSLSAAIGRIEKAIDEAAAPFEEAVALITTIPGVLRTTALNIIGETGADMSHFPTPQKLCAWGGVAPGSCESGGRKRPAKTRRGNRMLRGALVQAGHAAARAKGTYLCAQYRRIAVRRGSQRAAMAVGHTILNIVYHILKSKEPYKEMGFDYFDKRRPEALARVLIARLNTLGVPITIDPEYLKAA